MQQYRCNIPGTTQCQFSLTQGNPIQVGDPHQNQDIIEAELEVQARNFDGVTNVDKISSKKRKFKVMADQVSILLFNLKHFLEK